MPVAFRYSDLIIVKTNHEVDIGWEVPCKEGRQLNVFPGGCETQGLVAVPQKNGIGSSSFSVLTGFLPVTIKKGRRSHRFSANPSLSRRAVHKNRSLKHVSSSKVMSRDLGE